MSNRIKVHHGHITTRDDAEGAMNLLALTLNNQRKIVAMHDWKILAVRKEYEGTLATFDTEIDRLKNDLRAWAESNPSEFPKGRKSLDLSAGVLGFRTGTPKLALLSRAFTWEKVLGLLQGLPWAAGFVRVKNEVDKEAILGAHSQAGDKAKCEADLRCAGIKVVQEESFFIEAKLTDLAARQTVAAAG